MNPLPTRRPTAWVTALLGPFGVIPASAATSTARHEGVTTPRYWQTFAAGMVAFALLWGGAAVGGFFALREHTRTQDRERMLETASVGDCFDVPGAVGGEARNISYRSRPTPCTAPHNQEIVAVGDCRSWEELTRTTAFQIDYSLTTSEQYVRPDDGYRGAKVCVFSRGLGQKMTGSLTVGDMALPDRF